MPEKRFKHVCECKNCGNEAEMEVTCTLASVEDTPKVVAEGEGTIKGQAVCADCGGESDIWLESTPV